MTDTPLQFEIPADHPSLPGHFPGRPVVPGVVVLDRVFAAIERRLAGMETDTDAHAHTALAAVRMPQVKFVQPLLPGQRARIDLERIDMGRIDMDRIESRPAATESMPRWRFKVLRIADDALLASGEMQTLDEAASI
jgi:3-hydroxymyristoyl/3-hydroxydecanoyl-(acyl carrier protein) dehydratase